MDQVPSSYDRPVDLEQTPTGFYVFEPDGRSVTAAMVRFESDGGITIGYHRPGGEWILLDHRETLQLLRALNKVFLLDALSQI